jgi:sulfur-oxidizing protein SoxA
MVGKNIFSVMAIMGFGLLISACAYEKEVTGGYDNEAEKRADDPRNKNYRSGEIYSGYIAMTSQSRDMQDDDFANPGFVWVDSGESLWNKPNGSKGKSCASCHGSAAISMKGKANSFPRYDAKTGKMIALQAYLNRHMVNDMGAKKWKWESEKMLSLAIYVKSQSRGIPIMNSLNEQNRPFFVKGQKFFDQRRGLLDMSCKHCHTDNPGNMARSNVLSMGMPNGFPTYRLKWQGVGSIHRRFIGCNKNIRAKPYKRGSEEYTNLEFYMLQRAAGLKWETPSVRN